MRPLPKFPTRIAALGAALMIFGALSANAQPRQRMADPEARLERMMSHLTPELELTEDQVARVRTILSEQIAKQAEMMEARREGDREAREAMQTEMAKWRADTDSRMSEVLTEEQSKKYAKYVDKNRKGPRQRGGRRGRAGRRG